MSDQELEELINKYDESKFDIKKDFKRVVTLAEYKNLVSNCLNIFEKEFEVIHALVFNNNVNGLFNDNLKNDLLKSLEVLIPEYDKISSLIVEPKLESIHSNLLKLLRTEIDNITLIADPFLETRLNVLDKDQILNISKINYKPNLRYKVIRNQLKVFISREEARKSFKFNYRKLLKRTIPYLIVLLFISVIILNFIFSNEIIKILDNSLKIIGFIIVITWIPLWFFRNIPWKNKPLITILGLAFFSIFIPYFFQLGFLLSIILVVDLVILPVAIILNQSSKEFERSGFGYRKILFIPTVITLLLAFIITQEPLWLVGFVIWITFILISTVSSIYFRHTIDLISKQDISGDELIKDPWIFLAMFTIAIVLSSGVVVGVSKDFLINLYQTSTQIAILFVGFLLAIQGVLGNTYLKSESLKEQNLESQLILKLTEALKGFMLIFLSLFILSIIGLFSTNHLTELNFTNKWLTSHINYGDINYILVSLIFSSFLTILALSIGYLYYLFLSGNLILLPMKSRFQSKPVLISNVSSSLEDDVNNNVKDVLKVNNELNGRIIENLILENNDYGLFANIELEVISPEKKDLMNLAKILGRIFINDLDFSKVSVMVKSKESNLGLIKIFQVNLDEESLKFLEEDNGLNMEYKFIQLSAYFWSPAFKESHIL